MPTDRSAEYTRRKELCALNNLCIKCGAAKGTNKTSCVTCLEKRRNRAKTARRNKLAIGLCTCGQPVEPGKKACSRCLSRVRGCVKKTRYQYKEDGRCGSCSGPVTKGVTCTKCSERATRSTMKRYHRNILERKCAFCGGELSDTNFRCNSCNRAHVTRVYLKWHQRRHRVLTHYGGKCVCCDTTQHEFLEIDHMNGGGTKLRTIQGRSHFYSWIIRNNFPKDLQLLCANCNRGKSKFGICPHQVTPVLPTREWNIRLRRRRLRAIITYGGTCRCCGESNWAFLEFDHVNNDGRVHREELRSAHTKLVTWITRNHYPDTIQSLCSNCNKAKGLYGWCLHHKGTV